MFVFICLFITCNRMKKMFMILFASLLEVLIFRVPKHEVHAPQRCIPTDPKIWYARSNGIYIIEFLLMLMSIQLRPLRPQN